MANPAIIYILSEMLAEVLSSEAFYVCLYVIMRIIRGGTETRDHLLPGVPRTPYLGIKCLVAATRAADNTRIEPGFHTIGSISEHEHELERDRFTSAISYILIRSGRVEDCPQERRASGYPARDEREGHPDAQAHFCKAAHGLERLDYGRIETPHPDSVQQDFRIHIVSVIKRHQNEIKNLPGKIGDAPYEYGDHDE